MTIVRFAALALAISVVGLLRVAIAQDISASAGDAARTPQLDAVIARLGAGAQSLVNEPSQIVVSRIPGALPVDHLDERMIVDAIRGAVPTADNVVRLWDILADRGNASVATLPVIMALANVTTTARTRDALWSELAALSRASSPSSGTKAPSMLGLFETHRADLLPLLPAIRETEGAGDEMAYLMTSSHVFGGDIWESLFDMVKRNPGAVARHIERQRERGRPVKWEFQGFEGLMQWRDARFSAGAKLAPKTLDALDADGETFIKIFNALHSLDDWFRVQMLHGLGPIELFNAAVGGEQQLYRLGTSGYRDFLHPIILQGIKSSGSFEAFLEKALPFSNGHGRRSAASKRGLVFVRIASSFGLLDSVLDTVLDREAFIDDAIAALGDPRSFEGSSAIVVELLTGRSTTTQAAAFKSALLDRLYDLYRAEVNPARRNVYGGMLSAYQTVTADHRDSTIDRAFPLDKSMQQLPFDRLFPSRSGGALVHRIFMRMHDDIDAARTFKSFRTMMQSLGASIDEKRHHAVFRITAPQRAIEIYANKPNAPGLRLGIPDIAKVLQGRGVETIIGRGHTGIIGPLQADARRVLGDSVRNVATVIVGTCGSDASVREMISTFGYVPFVTAKSSGHQPINNEIIKTYIRTLLTLKPGDTLSMTQVLDQALVRFTTAQANQELREDAQLYQINLATALASQLFDKHVRRYVETQQRVSR